MSLFIKKLYRPRLRHFMFFMLIWWASYSTVSGEIVKSSYTGPGGRVLHFAYELPPEYRPGTSSGLLAFFHGNQTYSSTNETNFESWLIHIKSTAFSRGLVPLVLMSPDTVWSGGSPVRAWRSNLDGPLVSQFLLSNLDNRVLIDKSKIYLYGASQGTCFLDDFLRLYSDSLAGGILGECGCWMSPQHGFDPSRLKRDWKIYIAAGTEDYLHESSQLGFDLFYYMYKLDVRSNLLKPGGHCELDRADCDSALDWMMGKGVYLDENTQNYGWALAKDLGVQYQNGDIKWHHKSGFIVFVTNTAPLRTSILRSSDGYNWNSGPDIFHRVIDFDYLSDGTAVFITDSGMVYQLHPDGNLDQPFIIEPDSFGTVIKLQGTTNGDLILLAQTTIWMFDSKGNRSPYNGGWMRSRDGGKTWGKDTSFPGLNPGIEYQPKQSLIPIGDKLLLSLLVDSQLKMFLSSDGGVHWEQRNAPPDTLYTLRAGGGKIAALNYKYNMMYVSYDTARTWKKTALTTKRSVMEVAPDGRILSQNRIGLTTSDDGVTWKHEPGLLTVFDFKCAGSVENGIAAYSTDGWIFTYFDKDHPLKSYAVRKNQQSRSLDKISPVSVRVTKGALEIESIKICNIQWFDARGARLGSAFLRNGQSVLKPLPTGMILWRAAGMDGSKASGSLVNINRK